MADETLAVRKDAILLNVLIKALGSEGLAHEALRVFREMVRAPSVSARISQTGFVASRLCVPRAFLKCLHLVTSSADLRLLHVTHHMPASYMPLLITPMRYYMSC
jgi:pentatricopeptide repeat protein